MQPIVLFREDSNRPNGGKRLGSAPSPHLRHPPDQLVERDRIVPHPHARRVVDGVRHRRSRPANAQLADAPPTLIGSASGPRALREITPLVDRLEITASGRALSGGTLDMAVYASITEDEFSEAVARARAVRPDVKDRLCR